MCHCIFASLDSVLLILMMAISILVAFLDIKVLERMFSEFFLLKHFLAEDAFTGCYAPQAQMRMAFECICIYCALLCALLSGALAFNFGETAIHWVAKRAINASFVVFGPVLFVLSTFGFINGKALAKVCGVHGVVAGEFNYVCFGLLFVSFTVSVAVSYFMVAQKTMDMA